MLHVIIAIKIRLSPEAAAAIVAFRRARASKALAFQYLDEAVVLLTFILFSISIRSNHILHIRDTLYQPLSLFERVYIV